MSRWMIYLTIFLEGYAVLAIELLLMRQLTPYVGSATDILAIIIAAVLLPLAVGYHRGGQMAVRLDAQAAKRLLARNFAIAVAFFAAGMAHVHLVVLFETLEALLGRNHWLKAALYCGVFVMYPVYLLGQTLPVLSTVLPKDDLSRMTGRMLFYSTLGSFCGSIFSTLILMAWIGVHNTFNVTLCLLGGLAVLLGWHAHKRAACVAIALMAYTLMVNNSGVLARLNVVQNNAYSQVEVRLRENGDRLFNINRSFSSMIGTSERKYYNYIEFMDRYVLKRLGGDAPKHILVIGAGGFTLGLDDTRNTYTYLDIDPELQRTAEEHFLKAPLGPNKTFVAESARSYLRRGEERYDAIVVDAFSNRMTIPADLVTEEFFVQVRDRLKPGGVMVANIVTSGTFQSPFSRAIDTTLRAVFPYISRQILYTSEEINQSANVIYVYYNTLTDAPETVPYTDLLNRYFIDLAR